ncbi:MAG TPA: DNA mismatch repair protein MutS [Polyangiaceae bacterium]
MTPAELRDLYETRLARARSETETWAARSRRISNLRGAAFLVLGGALIAVFVGKEPALTGTLAFAAFVAFIAFVAWHGRILAREDAASRAAAVNSDALLRATGRFRELAEDGQRFQALEHPYADDLDLFGKGSLYQRIAVAHTRFGEEALARFLREPATPAAIERRQAAVRALAPELDLRQHFEALSFAVGTGEQRETQKKRPVPDPARLIEWAESRAGVSSDALATWGARLVPLVTLAGFVLWTRGAPPFLMLSALLVHFYLLFRASAHTSRAFTACSSTEGAFRSYGPMLRLIETLSLDAELLGELKARLVASKIPPSAAMARLERILGWFELRHNGLVYPIVNLVTLWDIHCTLSLERWREDVRSVIADWFNVLGEVEALSSLAGLAHDEADFCFPEVRANGPLFVADALGHPLIPSDRRVTNDVSLETRGSALLVTGSNMSGKSTLLRAMGLGAVLAFAGGPACARSLRLAPLKIRTSVRVSDSLERGVSHFLAEVKKLSLVLEANENDKPVFFLLDEILHGTNSRERQIGARWLLAELISRGAVGAVSTHDEELCRLTPELMSHVRLVHFRETVEGGKMTFDYKLREGPVKAGNALRVMQLAGLDVPLS